MARTGSRRKSSCSPCRRSASLLPSPTSVRAGSCRRLPGRTGAYLGLTGARIGLGDALALGLATQCGRACALPAVAEALAEGHDVDATLARFAAPPPAATLPARVAEIEGALFGADARGCGRDPGAAGHAVPPSPQRRWQTMRTKSPTSMAIALEQVRRGGAMSFAQVMQMEYRIVSHIGEGHDF